MPAPPPAIAANADARGTDIATASPTVSSCILSVVSSDRNSERRGGALRASWSFRLLSGCDRHGWTVRHMRAPIKAVRFPQKAAGWRPDLLLLIFGQKIRLWVKYVVSCLSLHVPKRTMGLECVRLKYPVASLAAICRTNNSSGEVSHARSVS
jgi:hypothetical protein